MHSQPNLRAALAFEGRFTPGVEPTGQAFRAECDFGIPGMLNMVRVELELPPLEPGCALANIWLFSPQLQAGRLYEGMEFKVFGRNEPIASGRVLAVAPEGIQNGA